MKGYCHVYTGNGKGKTTAAFGLALRAVGAGYRVYISQFVKGMEYSELSAFRSLGDAVTVRQFGRGCFIDGAPVAEDIAAARKGLQEIKEVLASGRYQVVILDEANIATRYGLISVEELLDLITGKPDPVELVITGRDADPRVIEAADLVTEMKEIKHYYKKGVQARKGIER